MDLYLLYSMYEMTRLLVHGLGSVLPGCNRRILVNPTVYKPIDHCNGKYDIEFNVQESTLINQLSRTGLRDRDRDQDLSE